MAVFEHRHAPNTPQLCAGGYLSISRAFSVEQRHSHLAYQRKQLIEDANAFLRFMASDVQCQKLDID